MGDQNQTKSQLLEELAQLRRRVAALEEMLSDSQRSEKSYSEEDRWYRFFLKDFKGIVFRGSIDFRPLLLTGAVEAITGYTAEEFLSGKLRWHQLIHPDDLAALRDKVEKLRTVPDYADEIEYRFRCRTGELRWVHEVLHNICDESGKPAYVQGVLYDVQARKTAEGELAKNRAIVEATIECVPFEFFVIGSDGRFVLENAMCRTMWGSLIGRTPEEMAPTAEVCALWLDNNRRAFAGERVEEEMAYAVQGKKRWVYNVLTPIRDGSQFYGILGVCVDITKRRLAEERLRESEERYRQLAESLPDFVYILDQDGRLLYGNQSAAKCVGLSSEALVGKTQEDLFPPDVAKRHQERIRRVLATGEPSETNEIYRFGENEMWLNVRSLPLRDGQGKVTAVMGICRDVTADVRAEETLKRAHEELEDRVRERTAELALANQRLQREVEERAQAQEALRVNEERLRLTLEAISDGFWERDLETDVLHFSPRHCVLLGYQPHEMPKTHKEWEKFIHPDDLDPALQRIVEYVDGRIPVFEVEFRAKAKSGEWRWMLGRGRMIYRPSDGRPIRMVGINIDIHDRKQAAEALRRSEERFRSYFQQGLVGMAVTTDEGRWIEVNDRLCEILGYSPEELLGMKWADATHPDDVESGLARFAQMRAGEIDQYTRDVRYIRKDGEIVYTILFIKCFRRPDGTVDHVFGLTEDITERHRAREALERERRTLEHMLRASDHERQLIAYDIHDGLAQYLTGAIMQLQISDPLRKRDAKAAAKAFDAGLAMVRESLSEARRLISGVRPPILDESGVVAAVAHLVYDFQAHEGPDIEFYSEVKFGRLTPILENAIYRIAQESLTNACKYSQSKTVRVELVQLGNELRIEIRDQGIGFDQKTVGEGRFGLEGIRERARLLGGKAVIESAPGQGTRIVAHVPIVPIVPRKENAE